MTPRMIIQHFPQNRVGRDFVVGDVHGQYDLLMTALDEVKFNYMEDRCFAVGDLIDRGPKNMEMLTLARTSWFHSVVGNHEDMMFQVMLGISYSGCDFWQPNGGEWSHAADKEQLKLAAKWCYLNMPLAIQINRDDEKIGITHAAPPVVWSEESIRQHANYLLWDREIIRHAINANKSGIKSFQIETEGVDKTYHGHTPTKIPLVNGSATWLDTGAFATNKLTLLEI